MPPSRNRLAAILLLAGSAVSMWASPAAAQTPVNAPNATGAGGGITDAPSAASRSWYGYQTLATDTVALSLAFIAADRSSATTGVAAASVYLLGAPTVHALHRRGAATLGSVALRIFVP